MTDDELRARAPVSISAAVWYLKGETYPEEIRAYARSGKSPYCTYVKEGNRGRYVIDVEALIAYKHRKEKSNASNSTE